jgi:hypothetical protein
MEKEHLDARAAIELLRRQEALQAEAQQLIVHLDLFTVLSHAEKPEQIGSTVSGLMVWRDIDFNVLCSHRSLSRVIHTMHPLLTHPHITKLNYTNESGDHRPTELHGDDRYYFVLYLVLTRERGSCALCVVAEGALCGRREAFKILLLPIESNCHVPNDPFFSAW